ncbi:Na/Pi cotransporter family protein [Geobacter sp. DSM 9736]|uniref:Na/Pi cotransporter family protein n=1 Tax=Geobacter sp. DSM 9736 TaxID=1277350 RepID=UPI000B50B4D0|nr:Na/Pi cotransporter family protein [Geobacter sp. DSM 9736]SNB45614.1 phosphate:Na+ symporter [Geobacter sp. DSM 9736]
MHHSFPWEALGGLGLFILGMKFMSEGLQKIAGERIRWLLEKIAGNRLSAALVGGCLSSLLQSSSAASIIVIGFVNAGLISLYQALGVLLGTGIGATVAVQFIAFKVSIYSLPVIFVGVLLKFFCRRRRWVYLGDMLLGAGLVFLGLQTMESGFAPLSHSTMVHALHNHLFSWRVTAVALGAALTFLTQSSSAAIGVIIAMAGSGMLSFTAGAAMVLGDVIGTSLIAAIASISGSLASKRTALVFFLINLTAVLLVLLFFPAFLKLVHIISPGTADLAVPGQFSDTSLVRPNIARHLANVHTVFSCICLLIFLPLVGFLARSARSILPGREGDMDIEPRAKYIDSRVINTPTIALLQVRNELKRMGEIARSMFGEVAEQFFRYDARRTTRLRQKEELLDILQREIAGFLVLLSRQPLNSATSMQIPVMLQMVTSLEHIGDQNETIVRCLMRKKEDRIIFSGAAMSELRNLSARVSEMVDLAVESLAGNRRVDEGAVQQLKDSLTEQHENMKRNHLSRLTAGKCTVLAGVLYSDIATAFMKIAEYADSIMEIDRRFMDESSAGGN